MNDKLQSIAGKKLEQFEQRIDREVAAYGVTHANDIPDPEVRKQLMLDGVLAVSARLREIEAQRPEAEKREHEEKRKRIAAIDSSNVKDVKSFVEYTRKLIVACEGPFEPDEKFKLEEARFSAAVEAIVANKEFKPVIKR